MNVIGIFLSASWKDILIHESAKSIPLWDIFIRKKENNNKKKTCDIWKYIIHTHMMSLFSFCNPVQDELSFGHSYIIFYSYVIKKMSGFSCSWCLTTLKEKKKLKWLLVWRYKTCKKNFHAIDENCSAFSFFSYYFLYFFSTSSFCFCFS